MKENTNWKEYPVYFIPLNFYMTPGIQELIQNNVLSDKLISDMLQKHVRNIDENIYEEDKKQNMYNILNGEGMVLSIFCIEGVNIYIISHLFSTEQGIFSNDTTILKNDEY